MDYNLKKMVIIIMEDTSKLRIRIPHHVKMSWTCPVCDMHFESVTPAVFHDDFCISPLAASINLNGSRPQKKSNTLRESPKKYLLYPTRPPRAQVNLGTNTYLS
jgi:hypothetical protein